MYADGPANDAIYGRLQLPLLIVTGQTRCHVVRPTEAVPASAGPRIHHRMRRRLRYTVLAAFALVVSAHLLMLAWLALDAGQDFFLPLLLSGAALFGLCAVALAWGGLVRGKGAVLVGALAALALYSAAVLTVAFFPNSDSAAPGDDPLAAIMFYLALLWTVALVGVRVRRRKRSKQIVRQLAPTTSCDRRPPDLERRARF